MDNDLDLVIRQSELNNDHIVFLFYQLLSGLEYIHNRGIAHRDLKPANVGVNEDFKLRILDFGSACLIQPDSDLTTIVTTQCYRAPELFLQEPEYSTKVDLWAAGCILVEMYTKKTLFWTLPESDQMVRILTLFGATSAEHPNMLLNQLVPGAPSNIVNLLEKLLVIDPIKRIPANEALKEECFSYFPRK
ncbi:mitogen-activated protein kinase [Cichlidogyrus casuarinus]|uniref:Mitogen-activated protein kinase n=1 Tax=Cichlidogyrus casuarinus TaxID=1844966 RepID=A0ABD2Q8K7_9PLAT